VRQSNSYIIFYASALTIVCGGLLALAAEGLRDRQQANIALEQKRNILATVMDLKGDVNVEEIYEKRIRAFVIDTQGNVKEGVKPTDVVLAVEYKKPIEQRLLPVYEYINENDPDKVDNVILPLYGFGLWNNIWGFVALESDFNTIKGVRFQHAAETPGLGARIETEEVQARYEGKQVFQGNNLVSVTMMKGEGNNYSNDPHKVDGMSGATLTAKGLNVMLKDYLGAYEPYIKKKKEANT
jgi:Na+-transporting NADH:ubiquinone oxidoreductase subunit C